MYSGVVAHKRVPRSAPRLEAELERVAGHQDVVVHVEHALRPETVQRDEPVVDRVLLVHVEDDGKLGQLRQVPGRVGALRPHDPDRVDAGAARVVLDGLLESLRPLEGVHHDGELLPRHFVPARRALAVAGVDGDAPEEGRDEEDERHEDEDGHVRHAPPAGPFAAPHPPALAQARLELQLPKPERPAAHAPAAPAAAVPRPPRFAVYVRHGAPLP
mmetsp:Transcript_10086/g.20485  ORF Transcript_10086/g.20485 Transcript_10086/m.20485 type:complete len:216 (-) Transcript_10086:137-784(-)